MTTINEWDGIPYSNIIKKTWMVGIHRSTNLWMSYSKAVAVVAAAF
jgi:hypothetical protein